MLSSLDFSGRRVLVTGGGTGIGKSIALKFLELKATVIVLDKDEQLLSALTTEYPGITGVLVDLSDWDAARKAVESILPIHHLANNAAITSVKPFLEANSEDFDAVYQVNFKAAMNVAQVVAKGMIAHEIRDGTIVSTSSIMDAVTYPGAGIYAAMKAALTMLTKTMAVELAPHGIRVNVVRPGAVNTEFLSSLPDEIKRPVLDSALNRNLFHSLIEPVEVANAFVFLSSSLAKSMTGTSLTIDQGYDIQ